MREARHRNRSDHSEESPGRGRDRHRHHDPFAPDSAQKPLEEGGRRGGRGGRGGGRGGGRRAGRGDVRTAVLLLLGQQPMHGYQIIQAIAERTQGAWRPSPGAVYPTLAQLEDEGLVTITAQGGRKLAHLTDAGHQHIVQQGQGDGDPFTGYAGMDAGPDLRGLLHELRDAARQVSDVGTATQVQAAADLLAEARRALYLLLATDPQSTMARSVPQSSTTPENTHD